MRARIDSRGASPTRLARARVVSIRRPRRRGLRRRAGVVSIRRGRRSSSVVVGCRTSSDVGSVVGRRRVASRDRRDIGASRDRRDIGATARDGTGDAISDIGAARRGRAHGCTCIVNTRPRPYSNASMRDRGATRDRGRAFIDYGCTCIVNTRPRPYSNASMRDRASTMDRGGVARAVAHASIRSFATGR